MASSIFCSNYKCENYFEDSCTKSNESGSIHNSESGACEDFEYGINDGYKDYSWYGKVIAEVNEIKKQVEKITHDL